MAPKFPATVALLFHMRFLRRADFILGDLMEEYSSGARSRGWLWRQTASIFWPGTRGPVSAYAPRKDKMNFLSSFWNDLSYSARALRKNPGFTFVAVLAIALGIGVNTGIFTVLNGVALRPLPVPGAGQIVSVYQDLRTPESRNVHGAASFFSLPEYKRYRDENHVFSGLLAYEPFLAVTLGGDRPQQIFGQLTSCNYFDVLNAPPMLGRALNASDCAVPGSGAVVVLNNDFWRSRFAADPAIIGRKIVLNRIPFTVVGVAPPGLQGTEPIPAMFWGPLTMQPKVEREFDWLQTENTSWVVLLGRLKPGISLQETRADLSVIAGRMDQLVKGRKTILQVHTGTLLGMPEARSIVSTVGALLLAGVGMVLLIACANVANLLLARAAGRQKEIAIRLSVGASRARLIRQLLTESVLIALCGGTLGSLIAWWSFDAVAAYVLSHLPHGAPPLAFSVNPDFHVLLYTVALTVATGIIFGLAPALQASRPDMNTALKNTGSHGSSGQAGGFLRNALVGAQMAVSMVLLIAAGLLLRGLYLAQTIDPGFEMKDIATIAFDLRGQGYDDARATIFQRQAVERLRALPGVTAVAQAWNSPLSDNHRGSEFTLPGEAKGRRSELNYISSDYLPMLGIPIVRGRNFTDTETRTDVPVAIVTETTARRIWPGKDPIGQVFKLDDRDYQVIGVAKDAQVSHLARSDETFMYMAAGPKEQMRLELLARGPGATAKAIRAVMHDLDPDLVIDFAKLEENLDFWRGPSRIFATLAGSLGALGLLLASIGLYGVVSYAVSRRVREIGIRMTLGADAREVKRLILWHAMKPVLIGALIGMAGSAGVSQVLKAMLFGASPYDPVGFVVVPLVLVTTALLASYIPARRATRVDPMVALRYE